MVFGDKGLREVAGWGGGVGEPPGQNSPVAGSCPNTGSRVCSEKAKSKGQPRKERLFSPSQNSPERSRDAPTPDAGVGNKRPRHRDTVSPSQPGSGVAGVAGKQSTL